MITENGTVAIEDFAFCRKLEGRFSGRGGVACPHISSFGVRGGRWIFGGVALGEQRHVFDHI